MEFWTVFPRRESKAAAWRCWKIRLKEGNSAEAMITAARHFAEYHREADTESRFIKMASTFLGRDRHYLEWIEPREPKTRKQKPESTITSELTQRARESCYLGSNRPLA